MNALERLANGEDEVSDAMHREELTELGGTANIAFIWGKSGRMTEQGRYKGGEGFQKIIEKHGIEDAIKIVETIAKGEIGEPYGVEGGQRVDIDFKDHHTTVSLFRNGVSKSWVLTGYTIDSNTDAKGRGSDLSNATQNDPIRTRAELGAVLKSAAKIRQIFDISEKSEKKDEIKYQRADSDVRFRGEGEAVFYSNAMRAVENIKQERATPEQWLKMIEKQGGMKAGEDKWLGLSEWLKGSDAKTLTKQEVLEYIRENEIRVEEVSYSSTMSDKAKKKLEEYNSELWSEIEELDSNDKSGGEVAEMAFGVLVDRYGDDFENAFELTWEHGSPRLEPQRDNVDGFVDEAKYFLDMDGDEVRQINLTRLSYTTEGLENKREIVLTVPTIEPWNEHDEVHFGEAGGGCAVAWIRFGETTDKDGKRVLVIDEIQSKRHQEGREKGYRPHSIQMADLQKAVIDAQERYDDYTRKMGEKYGGAYVEIYGEMSEEDRKEADRLENAVYAADAELEKHYSAVPDAPFEKNWHEVAMKRMLRFAAENGYDKVAWTKGEQQAERYYLSKSVKEIAARADGNGNYFIVIEDKDGQELMDYRGAGKKCTAAEVVSLLGKDLGERLMNGAEKTRGEKWSGKGYNPEFYTIREEGLKVGGEGMKGFYDQILPRFMDKYGKKWGVKTGEVELPNIGEGGLTMWSVDVTEDMRESVMRGQPLFRPKTQSREGGEEANAGEWYDRGSVERIGSFAGYTPEQVERMGRRQEESARNRFRETAEKLHLGDRIDFVESIDEVEGLTEKQREARRKKKGWYDPRTGRIVIILGNHRSMDDVMRSIMHEGVAHHGLRQMFGEHFDRFLDNVYMNASPEIRGRINEMAKRHGWDFRTATEEYLATLAEDTEFERPENQSWWGKVKKKRRGNKNVTII